MTSALALTTEERILLYLSDFKGMEDRYELPEALTQQSIARAAGIQRKHVSRYLKKMVAENLLVEKKSRIEGKKQRMLAYFLDFDGWRRAGEIKRYLGAKRIPILVKGKMKMMTLKEMDDSTSVHLTFSDIVREANRKEILRMEDLERIEERRMREMDERVMKIDAYARALMTAWQDGRVTATERLLIDQLREHLGIPDREHRRLEAEIIEKMTNRAEEFARIYGAVYAEAFKDGEISSEERNLLEALRREMGLSKTRAGKVEKLLRED